jgi:hypothetical protein
MCINIVFVYSLQLAFKIENFGYYKILNFYKSHINEIFVRLTSLN